MKLWPHCIRLNGLEYKCKIGFHPHEKKTRQKIVVDIEAGFYEIQRNDSIHSIVFDYDIANQHVEEFLNSTHYNLIETLGQDLCQFLILKFEIDAVKVTVTKFPVKMKNLKSVSYTCQKTKLA